jgi:carbamoyltransferase
VNILGLNLRTHDTAAALIQSGKLIAMADEERFNREKHSWKFPRKAVEFVLKQGNIPSGDLDAIAIGWKSSAHCARRLFRWYPSPMDILRHFVYHLKGIYGISKNPKDACRLISTDRDCPIYEVEHHLAHAASSFYVSPFEESVILTLDGHGEWTTALVAKGKGNKITKLKEVFWPQSLGEFYSVFSYFLGFPEYGDEYKMMGLAPYGRPTYVDQIRQVLQFDPKTLFRINRRYLKLDRFGLEGSSFFTEKFYEIFGPTRLPDDPVLERHQDIAHSVQAVFNEVVLQIADYIHELYPSDNLCLAGGVALNCVMNQHLRERSKFKNIFVQPAAGDSGVSIGAGYYVYHDILGQPRSFVQDVAYFGPEFPDDEIRKELDTCQIKYRPLTDVARETALLLADGKVIGWFQGRMEMGPRALGGRSILANPGLPQMKDIVNARIKFREEFRPFAPSVLESEATEYFDLSTTSPFMLFTANVKKDKAHLIPAVVHADNSARVQTVSRAQNPLYADLISELKKLTGVPVVLNTSFNVKGEPIVCSPADAIRCFFSTGLDHLVIGSFLVSKE